MMFLDPFVLLALEELALHRNSLEPAMVMSTGPLAAQMQHQQTHPTA